MAIFSSSGKTSKRLSQADTPRSSGQILSHLSTPADSGQARHATNNNFSPAAFAPEKTGHGNSPPLTLSSMEAKPPTGRYTEKGCLLDQKPESMVAESLRMKGELEFTRLLRVDGRFEGDLVTDKGSLVVGPKGEVIGDLKNMQEVYVEGIVRGNVFAHDVKVKNNGMLFGDIQCLCLTLDPTASIKGVADTATLKERAILEANPAPPSASSAASTTAKMSAAAASATSSAGPGRSPPSASSAATHPAKTSKGTPSAIAATNAAVVIPPPSSGVARPRPAVEDTMSPSGAAPSPAS